MFNVICYGFACSYFRYLLFGKTGKAVMSGCLQNGQREFLKTVWSYEYILKGVEEYCDFSDREQVKCGVLPWINLDAADIRWFDFVIFVSVVWHCCLRSIHIQIVSRIKYLLIIPIFVWTVPHRYLGTNANGIAVWIHITGNVLLSSMLLSSISNFQKPSQVLINQK